MMRKYKRVVEEEGNTSGINVDVEEGWELLVKKSGNPRRYRDALLKVECGYMVERLIADFGRRHGVCGDALTNYVGSFLHKRLFGGDGGKTYYPLEEEQWGTSKDGEDEIYEDNEEDDKDYEEDDGSCEDGMAVEEAGLDNE
jgi:hypothetical protein